MLSGTDVWCGSELLWTIQPVRVCILIPVSIHSAIATGGWPFGNCSGYWCRNSEVYRLPVVQLCEAWITGLRMMLSGQDVTGNFCA